MDEIRVKKQGFSNVIISDWPLLLLILGGMVAGAILYQRLPEVVPSHWNIKGEVNRYSSRFWGAFGIPLMTAGIYGLMLALPSIDPRRENYAKFAGVYRILKAVMVIFMTGIYLIVILSALGYPIPVGRVMPAGVSLLFIVFGNFMGQVRHNYFVGIKTPWTLANEQVWQKTHRLGGKLWVAAGLIGLVASIIRRRYRRGYLGCITGGGNGYPHRLLLPGVSQAAKLDDAFALRMLNLNCSMGKNN